MVIVIVIAIIIIIIVIIITNEKCEQVLHFLNFLNGESCTEGIHSRVLINTLD